MSMADTDMTTMMQTAIHGLIMIAIRDVAVAEDAAAGDAAMARIIYPEIFTIAKGIGGMKSPGIMNSAAMVWIFRRTGMATTTHSKAEIPGMMGMRRSI